MSLKYLKRLVKFLNREIQKGGGPVGGHNSIEDAKTCLDLVKKCEKGKAWGSSESQGENLFKRLAAPVPPQEHCQARSYGRSAAWQELRSRDWGDLARSACSTATVKILQIGLGGRKLASSVLGKGDPDGLEVPGGGVDFVYARMRELEAIQAGGTATSSVQTMLEGRHLWSMAGRTRRSRRWRHALKPSLNGFTASIRLCPRVPS